MRRLSVPATPHGQGSTGRCNEIVREIFSPKESPGFGIPRLVTGYPSPMTICVRVTRCAVAREIVGCCVRAQGIARYDVGGCADPRSSRAGIGSGTPVNHRIGETELDTNVYVEARGRIAQEKLSVHRGTAPPLAPKTWLVLRVDRAHLAVDR